MMRIERILEWFRTLQPVEKKAVISALCSELNGNSGIECTYCGRRTGHPVWLSNIPLCRSCYSRLFSLREKIRLVYGRR